jgi:hypothetical protein
MRWALFLLLLGAWALGQAPGVPRPKPPEEPKEERRLEVRILYQGQPAPGVLVALYPLGPNLLPTGRGTLRLTDQEGRAFLPLPSAKTLLSLRDPKRGFSLQIPLEEALGTWSLGPYQLEIALRP